MKGNLRMVPEIVQNRNKRNNILVNDMCITEICEKYGIKTSAVYSRKRRHKCSTEEAVLYYLNKLGVGCCNEKNGKFNK